MACVKKIRGKYRADFRDRAGKRYRKFFATKKAADDWLDEQKAKVKDGSFIAPKEIPTLREIGNQWLDNKKGMKLRPSTISCYRVNLERHILEAEFADVKVDRIGLTDITTFRSRLSQKRAGKDATLSAKTVNYVMRDLQAIFAYAMKARLVTWNPAAAVDRLKEDTAEHDDEGPKRTDVAVTEDEILSPTDCKKLIDAAPEGYNRALLMAAVLTGARHSELLALKWADVDFDEKTIHFRRSLSWAKLPGEPTHARFFDTKTGKKGNRKIPCPAELMLELKKWRLRCPKGELDLVFPSAVGEPQHRAQTLENVLRPALLAAELSPNFHMHSLRHSFCSALLAQGTPPTEVQKYSGHRRLSTLLDVYSHFIPSEKTSSLEQLASKMLGGVSG